MLPCPHPERPCIFLPWDDARGRAPIGKTTLYRLVREGVVCADSLLMPPNFGRNGPRPKICLEAMRAYRAGLKPFVPARDDEMLFDAAAEELGVNRATLYNWRAKGIPFLGGRKLATRTDEGRDALGRRCGYRFVAQSLVDEIKEAMKAAAAACSPRKAEIKLGVCRSTLDNLRRRGELTGTPGVVLTGNYSQDGFSFRPSEVDAVKAKAKAAAVNKDWRHVDGKGRKWMLGKHVAEVYGLSRRYQLAHRNPDPPEWGGGGFHFTTVPNPRKNGRFSNVKVYLETDAATAAGGGRLDGGPGASAEVLPPAATSGAPGLDQAVPVNGPATPSAPPGGTKTAAPMTPPTAPRWDERTGTLYWGDLVIREFRKHPAGNQRALIEAFHRKDWSANVPNPFRDPRKLNLTIYQLNLSLAVKAIRFRGDGTTQGVVWEAAE